MTRDLTPRERALADEMALAVLRGNRVDAYALAELLVEESHGKVTRMAEAAEALRQRDVGRADDGYRVYQWPEFRAFCDRAGILWDLRTISISFTVQEGGRLEILHKYAAADDETQIVRRIVGAPIPGMEDHEEDT